MEALGNELLKDLSTKQLYEKRVCQNHFEEACFLKSQKRLLRHDALPTRVDTGNGIKHTSRRILNIKN